MQNKPALPNFHLAWNPKFLSGCLTVFVIFSGIIASVSVLLNDLYFFWVFSPLHTNLYFFCIGFLFALSGSIWGFTFFIFLVPLSAGLGGQLNAYFGASLLTLPNTGLDLAAGFYLGYILRLCFDRSSAARWRFVIIPWPVAACLLMITLSTIIAICRNLFQAASITSFKGLLFNLLHFRPIGWGDAYMPISDWIAYALSFAILIIVMHYLASIKNKEKLIFRPIIFGLVIAALMSIVQSITGLGLPESLINFRKDSLGYAAIGFQPDLHAFAGHMVLGAVGLWIYLSSKDSKWWRLITLSAIVLSWVGLILSKSRALLIFAVIAMMVGIFIYLWKKKRKYFFQISLVITIFFVSAIVMVFSYSENEKSFSVLSWIPELAQSLKSRDLFNSSDLGGILGSRLEIWGAAFRMFWQFPLAGLGQGNFYHLSSINFFSKSQFLILNGGENSHNYFLQTLVEIGLIGCIFFILLFLVPYLKSENKSILLPAVIALFSLSLGNIFSHSFLVRENLILGAIFLGLLYSQSEGLVVRANSRDLIDSKWTKKALLLIYIVAMSAYCLEVYKSFGKGPFTKGLYCYKKESLTEDGWMRGVYITPILPGTSSVDVDLEMPHFGKNSQKEKVYMELRHVKRNQYGYYDVVDSVVKEVSLHQKNKISIAFSDNQSSDKANNIELEIRLDTCYSPRNLGHSVDSRLLGAKIRSIDAH